MQLEHRIALVTGAGQGVGEGIARRLHAAGATVLIAEYNEDSGRKVADSLPRAHFLAMDVSRREQVVGGVEEAIGRFGALDILVNNAYPTGTPPARLENRADGDFERALAGGFMGPCGPCRRPSRRCANGGGGG